jgi:ABC-type polar amino acid transport system ATPase subunit
MARFLSPLKGAILLDGKNIFEMNEVEFRKQLGVVFQGLNLFPHMTVLQNLMLAPQRVQGCSKAKARIDAMEMLERLKISELARNYPAQISGGEAQRAAIARGLMLHPQFMLLDEPTSALDARTTSNFTEWLLELQSDTTFIIVTHDIPFAQNTAQKGVFMNNGKVIEQGKIIDILKKAE